MKRSDTHVLALQDDTTTHAGRVRLNAAKYLRSVVEDTDVIPDITSFDELLILHTTMLGGGKDAITYLVNVGDEQWVIKLGLHGLEAEAEALQKWAAAAVHVPHVIGTGVVPITSRITPSVKYLVEDAIADKFGRPAEMGDEYLARMPEGARKLGRLMGSELAKMHTASSDRPFGNFADQTTDTAPAKSWNSYLLDELRVQRQRLSQMGVSAKEIKNIRDFIKQCRFVKKGSYLHGDFSIRNTVVLPYRNHAVLQDPNPLIGDPSWDAAIPYNLYEFRKRRYELDGSNKDLMNRDLQLFIGFKQAYYLDIPEDNLLTARLFHALSQAEYQEHRLSDEAGNRIELTIRQEFIREIVDTMCRKIQNK